MLKCTMPVLLMLSLITATALAAETRLVTPRAPGGVFVEGKPIIFDITGAKGSLSYRINDYFGAIDGLNGKASKQEIRIAPLPAGWYTLDCTDEVGVFRIPFGVVIDRGYKLLPEDGRVCSDAASAWLIQKPEYRKPFAQMIRTAGIPWVRERLSWPATEPTKGRIDWAQYQTVADTLNAEGVRISQVFHQTPDWAASPAPDQMRPKDLRDLYRYMKTAASHFSKQIPAWEVWNEMDIDFWTGLPDSFAGVQKAAYLGIKAGNPQALVLQSSLSHVAWSNKKEQQSAWLMVDGLYESGIGDYFDIFNWHSYTQPKRYPEMLEAYRGLMNKHRYAPRQEWLTECGMPQQAEPEMRVLTEEAQRAQCRFVPRSVIMGLASGTEKYFWFVLPDYMEGKNQFGILRPDLSPYPGFIALSAAANILGQSDYLGYYKPEGCETSAQVFRTPQGIVAAAWSDAPAKLALPTEKASVQVADCFGAKRKLTAENGRVTVNLGPEAVYVLDLGEAILPAVQKAFPARETALPKNNPSKVVLAGRCDLPIDRHGKACNTLVMDGATPKPFEYTVEVYNFDESKGATGSVEITAPTGWQVDQPKRELKLEPMGREELKFHVTPAAGSGEVRISAWGKFGSPAAAPTVSRIR